MADHTYTLSASVTMERNTYTNEHDYIVKGTGNVSGLNCAPKVGHNIRSYEKKYVPT